MFSAAWLLALLSTAAFYVWCRRSGPWPSLTRNIPSSMAASTMALSSSSSAVRSPEMARWISGAASSSMVRNPA